MVKNVLFSLYFSFFLPMVATFLSSNRSTKQFKFDETYLCKSGFAFIASLTICSLIDYLWELL